MTQKRLAAAILVTICFLLFAACGNDTKTNTPDVTGDGTQGTSDSAQTGTTPDIKPDTTPDVKPDPQPEKYTVTFDFSDGRDKETVTAEKGSTVNPPQTPVRENHRFNGWLDGTKTAEFPYTVTKNTTLRASWTYVDPLFYSQPKEEITVIYGEKGGPECEVRLKKGYIFLYQWYKNSTPSRDGAVAVEGGNDRILQMPRSIKAGDASYYYCEISEKKVNGDITNVFYTDYSKVTVKQGSTNILVVGSGTVKQANKHDSIEYLESMLKESGWDVAVDRITNGSNYNIWEEGLTGSGQSKIREKMEQKAYSYVILQMGRDYAVCTEKTRTNEINAYKNILAIAEDTRQECEFILIEGPWRQDTTSKYYVERFISNGIDTAEKHAAAVRALFDDYIIPVKPDAKISDMITAFELAQSAGLDPFGSATNDFPGLNGSYLVACMNYANITGKSPEGLKVTSCSIGNISSADAAALQKIAAQVVFGS